MNRRVVFHPEAEDELHDATSYYDAESPGLGNALLDDLERAIAQIIQYPESSPLVSKRVRRKPHFGISQAVRVIFESSG